MQAIRRADGRLAVFIPAEESPTGKRQAKYFKYKSGDEGADKFIRDHEANRREHGNHAVTAEEVHWISIARAKLGSLAKLGEVLEHWRKTGANVKSISARDAVDEFIQWRLTSNRLKPRTADDIRIGSTASPSTLAILL